MSIIHDAKSGIEITFDCSNLPMPTFYEMLRHSPGWDVEFDVDYCPSWTDAEVLQHLTFVSGSLLRFGRAKQMTPFFDSRVKLIYAPSHDETVKSEDVLDSSGVLTKLEAQTLYKWCKNLRNSARQRDLGEAKELSWKDELRERLFDNLKLRNYHERPKSNLIHIDPDMAQFLD